MGRSCRSVLVTGFVGFVCSHLFLWRDLEKAYSLTVLDTLSNGNFGNFDGLLDPEFLFRCGDILGSERDLAEGYVDISGVRRLFGFAPKTALREDLKALVLLHGFGVVLN